MLANSPILPVLLAVPMAIALTSISNPLATSNTLGNSTTNFKFFFFLASPISNPLKKTLSFCFYDDTTALINRLMIPVQTLSGQFHSDPTTPFIYLVLANLKPYHFGRSLKKNSTIICPYFSIIKRHIQHP
ncbi:hypothetical protein PPACK8108_LOCUS20035 [Phakopsora pachyrhizi]|uniref:Secreted protein n=1 Tax=Phakopsora pachyrhizi TaxID=170000 RepID=A0AAV0BHF1_PHAPC|nr:hypothetical protein PPACK8108_LOCUS20035 [Phakopsora pachyrhizi]